MNTVKMTTLTLLSVLLLFFSCAGTRPLEKMVPRESSFYVQITNTDAFLESIDEFMASLRLNRQMPGIKDTLHSLLSQESSILPADYLDFSRSAGFAGLPGESGEKFDFILFVPVYKGSGAEELIPGIEDTGKFSAVFSQDYLVLFSSPEMIGNFPPKKALDTRSLRDASPETLHAYLNIEQLFAGMGIDKELFSEAMNQSGSADMDFAKRFMDAYFNFFRSIDASWTELSAGSRGIMTRGSLSFRNDTAKLVSSFHPVTGTKDFPFFSMDADRSLFNCLYNFDSRDREKILEAYMGILFSSDDPAAKEIQSYMEMYKKMNAAMGNRGSMSMGFELAAPGQSLTENMIPGFWFTSIAELTDPDLYAAGLDSMYADNGWRNMMKAFFKSADLPGGLEMQLKKGPRALEYREISFGDLLKNTGNTDLPGPEAAALQMLGSMKIYYVIQDNFCYTHFTTGNSGPRFLEIMSGTPETAAADPSSEWLRAAPDDAHMIWNFQLEAIMRTAGQFLGGKLDQLPAEPGEVSGYVKADEIIYSGMRIPSEEINWMIGLFALLK